MMSRRLDFGNLGTKVHPLEWKWDKKVIRRKSNAGVEVPVSNTPLGVDNAREVTFGMQGNGNSVTLGVGNLGFALNLESAGGLEVGELAGSFDLLEA